MADAHGALMMSPESLYRLSPETRRLAHARFSQAWNFQEQPTEIVDCNLCGASAGFVPEAYMDRHCFDQSCVRCTHCDLVFLNPRMTREAYAEFYARGYRPLLSVWAGKDITPQSIQRGQAVYAEELLKFLGDDLILPYQPTVLDVGGSTGVIARRVAGVLHGTATVLDPAAAELAEAVDLNVIPSMVEDFDPGDRRWDLILMCQTVDHLLDIKGTLYKLHDCLSEHGYLFVDIVDYDRTRTVKLDHPYNLTRGTMEAFLEMTGFRVVKSEDSSGQHVAYLCVKEG